MKRSYNQPINVIERFNLFLELVSELKSTRFFKSGYTPMLQIKCDSNKDVKFELKEKDWEDFVSFLSIYRQFFLKRELIFIEAIHNFGHKHITDKELKFDLAKAKSKYKKFYNNTGLRIMSKGKEITPKHVYDLWMNTIFHKDIDKISELKSFDEFILCNYRFQFLGFVCETTKHILYVEDILTKAFERDAISETPIKS